MMNVVMCRCLISNFPFFSLQLGSKRGKYGYKCIFTPQSVDVTAPIVTRDTVSQEESPDISCSEFCLYLAMDVADSGEMSFAPKYCFGSTDFHETRSLSTFLEIYYTKFYPDQSRNMSSSGRNAWAGIA